MYVGLNVMHLFNNEMKSRRAHCSAHTGFEGIEKILDLCLSRSHGLNLSWLLHFSGDCYIFHGECYVYHGKCYIFDCRTVFGFLVTNVIQNCSAVKTVTSALENVTFNTENVCNIHQLKYKQTMTCF